MQSDLVFVSWSIGEAEHLERLLWSAMLTDQEYRMCKAIIANNDSYSMKLLRSWLYERQVDPITNGTYNIGQLTDFVDKISK